MPTNPGGSQMVGDDLDKLGPLMNEIGQVLTELAGGDARGIFLHVEIGRGWVGPSVFKDEGNTVRYLDSDTDLDDLLFDAWYTMPEDKRWSVMGYDLKDGEFSVAFRYPEEVDVERSFDDNIREAALRARYGDKPVLYPPMPESASEFKP